MQQAPAEVFAPGEYLKDELEAREWTQAEFSEIIGRPAIVVNQIIAGKRAITPTTAKELAAAFGTSALFWLNLEAAYRLHQEKEPVSPRISRQAKLRERFAVREMLKRSWIHPANDPEELEAQVLQFFGISSIDETPRLAHAAKRSGSTAGYPEDLNGAQRAWLFRVKQIAETMSVPAYSEDALRARLSELAELRISADAAREVPRVLSECGVRFVIVEHVPTSRIDGACFWLARPKPSPVIGMSLRLDRIDNFWFVLRHEIEHVLRGHGRETAIVDTNTDALAVAGASPEEMQANEAGAEFCVPTAEMQDFISRNRPLFSRDKIENFARRMQVHPGLVAGQLRRSLDKWTLWGEHLVKMRHIVAGVAMTDGYGHIVPIHPPKRSV